MKAFLLALSLVSSLALAKAPANQYGPSGDLYASIVSQNTRDTRPAVLSYELGGRSRCGGFYFDYAFGSVAIGTGIASGCIDINQDVQDEDDLYAKYNGKGLAIPLYANYYIGSGSNFGFATAGVNGVLALTNMSLSSSASPSMVFAVVPHAGLGYEYRGDAGLLIRLAGYWTFMFVNSGFSLGASIGLGF